jgi:hypothetical protein
MEFENIIREMDQIRNEDDMKLSFRFNPRYPNEYGKHSEIKKQALNNSKSVMEFKETEEAIRFAAIESGLDRNAELNEMNRLALTEQLQPILETDYQEAVNHYYKLKSQYEEKYADFQEQLNTLIEESVNQLLPITRELADIEAANDYLFYSKGPYSPTMNSGIHELIDTDIKPIAKTTRTLIKPQKKVTMGEVTQKFVYPFLNRIDRKETLVNNLIEGVYENE